MSKQDRFWTTKNVPMHRIQEKYIRWVNNANIHDLKTKYTMIIITDTDMDNEVSHFDWTAFRYANGQYWIKQGGETDWRIYADDSEEQEWNYGNKVSKDAWRPIALSDIIGEYTDEDGEMGGTIYVIPKQPKGFHSHRTTAPKTKGIAQLEHSVRRMF